MSEITELTYEEVSKLLRCDFSTGKLFWLPRPLSDFRTEHHGRMWNTRYAGKEAFNTDARRGYLSGSIYGRTYKTHRVVWMLGTGSWPSDQIDHINGNRSDNRLENLRDVSRVENCRNMARPITNTSGVVGVHWSKQAGKWLAVIKINRAKKHLGYFDEFEDAVARRKAEEAALGFHPNHGRAA